MGVALRRFAATMADPGTLFEPVEQLTVLVNLAAHRLEEEYAKASHEYALGLVFGRAQAYAHALLIVEGKTPTQAQIDAVVQAAREVAIAEIGQ